MKESLVLPVGTQVISCHQIEETGCIKPAGAVGKILESPANNRGAYTVLFADGSRASIYREQLQIRKHVQNLQFDRQDQAFECDNLYECIIYRCVVGSRAFGLNFEDSDFDRRGIFLPPAEMHWSLYGVPEQIEKTENEECYWELQKFLVLALKANPNVLECLYTQLVEHKSEIAEELLAERKRFLSKLVYQTYNGYVLSQFRKLEQDLRNRGELKWKHVMHLLRLLYSGISILENETVPVDVGVHKDELMEIRLGKIDWETLNERRLELHKKFDLALLRTKLPERPDYEFANSFLIKARRSMV